MNSDQLIEQGDFEGALEVLRQSTSGARAEPAALLSQFSMEVRLQQFDAAETTIQRLCAVAPETAEVMKHFAATARAERIAIQRLSDPTLAGKRSAPGLPPPYSLALVKASLLHAQGDHVGAKAAIAEANGLTPPISGTVVQKNGSTIRFTKITDTDDLTSATLPVYEGSQVLDIGYSEIHSIYFDNPRTSFDVMWPRAAITLVTGEIIRGRVPALYPGSGRAGEKALRTGQMTMWSRDKGYAEGIGQRDLSLTTANGSSIMGLLSIASITFDNPLRQGIRSDGAGQFGISNQDRPWTTTERAVAWAAGILYAIRFFRPSLFYSFESDGPPVLMILSGLVITGCAGWLAFKRSTKVNAAVVVVIVFALTTLKWLM
jgi:protein involved in temperature-dependent protein secretion